MKMKSSAVSIAILSAALLGMSTTAFADKDEGGFMSRMLSNTKPGVAPVEHPQYLEECGACHFAYQPGLLPARSWSKLMAGLDNHFGENAELPADTAKALESYLLQNAADHANYRRSQKILASIPQGDAPLRISETPYFVKKHRELPPKMVQDNPEVGSFSKCGACHTQAAKGSYSEREILIPGFGRWED